MIAIIDYDAGNIKSVEKALLALGEQVAAVGGFGPEKVCLAAPGASALHIILKVEENEL